MGQNCEIPTAFVLLLSSAFSSLTITAKESTMHKYFDLFVDKMKSIGSTSGVYLARWCVNGQPWVHDPCTLNSPN
ncbi:hypothetical protein F4779DRAFT_597885 [Xylariaceae sp. FL0662B]|nr:hypothetical protein F4779DRAFT_597885 [Xylariaceae sp. FL0662B]